MNSKAFRLALGLASTIAIAHLGGCRTVPAAWGPATSGASGVDWSAEAMYRLPGADGFDPRLRALLVPVHTTDELVRTLLGPPTRESAYEGGAVLVYVVDYRYQFVGSLVVDHDPCSAERLGGFRPTCGRTLEVHLDRSSEDVSRLIAWEYRLAEPGHLVGETSAWWFSEIPEEHCRITAELPSLLANTPAATLQRVRAGLATAGLGARCASSSLQ